MKRPNLGGPQKGLKWVRSAQRAKKRGLRDCRSKGRQESTEVTCIWSITFFELVFHATPSYRAMYTWASPSLWACLPSKKRSHRITRSGFFLVPGRVGTRKGFRLEFRSTLVIYVVYSHEIM